MTTRAAPSPATEPRRKRDDGHGGEVGDDVIPIRGWTGTKERRSLSSVFTRTAATGAVDEPDDRHAQLARHAFGVHLLLEDRCVGGPAPHGEVVAADHDRPAVDAAAPHHEVGRGEVEESAVVVVGRASGDRADLVKRSRVEERFDAFAHRELAAVVLTLNLLRPTHPAGQFLTSPKFGDLGLPGIPHAADRTGPSRGRPTSSRVLDDRQTSR